MKLTGALLGPASRKLEALMQALDNIAAMKKDIEVVKKITQTTKETANQTAEDVSFIKAQVKLLQPHQHEANGKED